MTEHLKAWQCVGCGRIEGQETCIGICEGRPVEFVYAADYKEALREAASARVQAEGFIAIVRQLALTTPREGEWERTYRALQLRARDVMGRKKSQIAN